MYYVSKIWGYKCIIFESSFGYGNALNEEKKPSTFNNNYFPVDTYICIHANKEINATKLYKLKDPRSFQDLFFIILQTYPKKSVATRSMNNFIPVSMALIWMNEWMCHRFAKNADFEEVDLTLTDPRESRKK